MPLEFKAKSTDDAVNALLYMRQYKPYQYGGRWYVGGTIETGFYAYRSPKTLSKKLIKEGLTKDQDVTVYLVE